MAPALALAGHAKVAMPPGGRPCGESPGIAEEGVLKPVVKGVFVKADAEEVESRLLSFDHHGDPAAARASTELLRSRSYRLSCAILWVSIADPRRLGAGPSGSLPSWPTNCGSMSVGPGGYTPLSDDILRFVP